MGKGAEVSSPVSGRDVVQHAESAGVPEPATTTATTSYTAPSVPRQTCASDQEKRYNRRLQGHKPGPGFGYQWEGVGNRSEKERGEVRAEGENVSQLAKQLQPANEKWEVFIRNLEDTSV